MAEPNEKFIVLRDTREKQGKGWRFIASKYCAGMKVGKLQTGDYSLLGYERIITIERKGSVSEFANNLIQARFYRELDRLEEIKYPYIILEFSLRDLIDYPYSDAVPPSVRNKICIKGKFLLKKLCEIELKYRTRIIFAGNSSSAKEMAFSLFKRVVEVK